VSSIVIEVQQDALDKSIRCSDLLRKALVAAKKLKVVELEEWVSQELNGYQDIEKIPEYRQIRGSVRALNPYHGWQPVVFTDPKKAEMLSRRPCNQSIAEIESLLDKQSDPGTLAMPFPSKTEQQLREAIEDDLEITLIVPSTALVKIVDTIRTIILNWALKLEEDGILGEGLSFNAREREAASKTSYNITNFYGPVQSPQIQQDTAHSAQISSGQQLDVNALREFLEAVKRQLDSIGLTPDAKRELDAEIKAAEAQTHSPRPGHPAIMKALDSIKRILEGAGGGMVAQLLAQLAKLLGWIS
jgi:hypothetical protein